MKTFIERVPVDNRFGDHLDRWKQLRREGWDLAVVVPKKAPSYAVAFGVFGR